MDARLSARCALLLSAAMMPLSVAAQTAGTGVGASQTEAGVVSAEQSSTAAPTSSDQTGDDLETIVVTGQTTRGRQLITASADITYATREDIDRRAPRSTADLLELVPGIFVEATAGELSNNYSVRGLQGGGQRFIQLEQDGLPVIYQGGGADFFFAQDLTIDRFEAVKGGSSGVLTVNGAGATINFISRRPNFREPEGIARFTGASYGLYRGDLYYSMPITDKLAFSLGGFFQTSPGVRKNPFSYDTYQVKGVLEYRMDDGGFIRLSGQLTDRNAAYYATQPYAFRNGDPTGVPGFDPQFGNIAGEAFGRIDVPTSPFLSEDGFRPFRWSRGVKVITQQIRLDIEKPVTDDFRVFARARYLGLKYDFNGLFPGSGTGNAGLASAVEYLTPGPNSPSPIAGLLAQGSAAFPGTTQFGIRNLRNGVVTPRSAVGALDALNGNGFLQQTTLNHDKASGWDFGSNFGAAWDYKSGIISNSLTAGVLVFNVGRHQNQSSTASVLNDVRNNSNIYDVVALNGQNQVIGTLTDNGILQYGNWGVGIRDSLDTSVSVYVNDEIQIGDNLRIDGGVRYEHVAATFREGQALLASQLGGNTTGFQLTPQSDGRVCADPRPVGLIGVNLTTPCTTFNGVRTTRKETREDVAWTVGVNYLIKPHFSVYGRYAVGFQTNNVNPTTGIVLYEGGLRFNKPWLTAQVTYFRTDFDDQFYQFIDPTDPTRLTNFQADLSTEGVEVDFTIRPVRWFALDFQGVFQKPTLNNLRLDGVLQTSGFDGNVPERTPETLFTITPTVQLPGGYGEVYARYKYIGEIFADSGNGLALPAYGVTSVGVNLNVTERVQVSFNAENIFDEIGLTEGNPRQGQVQNAESGFFYGRGIVGPTYGGSVTLRF